MFNIRNVASNFNGRAKQHLSGQNSKKKSGISRISITKRYNIM